MSNWKNSKRWGSGTENAWSKKGKTYRAKTLSALKDLYSVGDTQPPKVEGSSKLVWGEPKGISPGLKKRKEAQSHGNPFDQEFTD